MGEFPAYVCQPAPTALLFDHIASFRVSQEYLTLSLLTAWLNVKTNGTGGFQQKNLPTHFSMRKCMQT